MAIRTILRIGHRPTTQEILNLIADDQEWSVDCRSGDMDAFLAILERHGVTWRQEAPPVGRNWRIGTGPLPAELIAEIVDLRATFWPADSTLITTFEVQASSTGRTLFRLIIRDPPPRGGSTWVAFWPEAIDMLAMILERHEVDNYWDGPSLCAGPDEPSRAAIADILYFLNTVAE